MKTSTSHRLAGLPAIACAAAAVLLSLGCASPPVGTPQPDEVQAMLLVHSGRPNPTFVLDETATAKLAQLLTATTANSSFKRGTVTPSILGYQGVIVINGAKAPGLPNSLSVYGEDVETTVNEATSFRKDPGRGLESFLLEQAIAHKAITREELARIR